MTDERREFFSIVAVLAADRRIAPEEKAFLRRAADRLGASEADFDRALDAQARHEAKIDIPLDPRRRSGFIRTLIEAAKSDGILHPAEQKLIGAVAMRVGFPLEELAKLIKS